MFLPNLQQEKFINKCQILRLEKWWGQGVGGVIGHSNRRGVQPAAGVGGGLGLSSGLEGGYTAQEGRKVTRDEVGKVQVTFLLEVERARSERLQVSPLRAMTLNSWPFLGPSVATTN